MTRNFHENPRHILDRVLMIFVIIPVIDIYFRDLSCKSFSLSFYTLCRRTMRGKFFGSSNIIRSNPPKIGDWNYNWFSIVCSVISFCILLSICCECFRYLFLGVCVLTCTGIGRCCELTCDVLEACYEFCAACWDSCRRRRCSHETIPTENEL